MGKEILTIFIKLKLNKIGFFKEDDIYAEKNKSDNNIEVIEWDFPNIDKSRIRSSKEEVLEQVLSGLESVNQSLGTNYKLSQIYFTPFDSSANSVYRLLICKLIRHYHSGNEFKEV